MPEKNRITSARSPPAAAVNSVFFVRGRQRCSRTDSSGISSTPHSAYLVDFLLLVDYAVDEVKLPPCSAGESRSQSLLAFEEKFPLDPIGNRWAHIFRAAV